MFSMCFPEEFIDCDMLMDPTKGTDDVTPHDSYVDEMGMIGISHILDIAPHGPRSAFDMFGVFMLEIDDDDFVTDVSHDDISVEGASDFVDPPLSFDTMSGFVTRYDGMSTKYHNI